MDAIRAIGLLYRHLFLSVHSFGGESVRDIKNELQSSRTCDNRRSEPSLTLLSARPIVPVTCIHASPPLLVG